MLAVHTLLQNGHQFSEVMQMDEQDLLDWLDTAAEYNRLFKAQTGA